MKTKDILKSDKAWELGSDEVIRAGDFVEYQRGIVDPVAESDRVCGLKVSQLNAVGLLGIFRARAFRTGMINYSPEKPTVYLRLP